MKFLFKLLLKAGITLGVMFIGYKYILTSGGGGFQIPGMAALTEKAPEGISEIGNAVVQKDVTVYKWVDEKGVTQFGSAPPIGQGDYEKKEIKANTNVMSAVKAREEEEVKSGGGSRVSRIGNVYSPEGVKNLMDDTKNTSQQASDRMAEQEKMLNDIMNSGKK